MSAYTGRIPWVGSPLGRNATLDHRSLWFLPPSGLPEGPTLSTGGNIPRIRRRAIAGERRVSARRVIRGVWLGLAAEAFPLYLPTRGDAGIFYFFSVGSVFFRPLPFFTKRQNRALALYRFAGSKTPWVRGPAISPRCFDLKRPGHKVRPNV